MRRCPPVVGHRYLIRRIAWRLQANAEGDLSERGRARAAELALDSEVRVSAGRLEPRRFETRDWCDRVSP